VGYYKAKVQFTEATPRGMIVGHPEHQNPRGRFFKLDDVTAGPLVVDGKIAKITRAAYEKGIEGGEVDGGDVLVHQVSGQRPPVSARWTNDALAAEAALRGVDISKAENRAAVIRLINAKETSSAPDEVEGTDNAWSQSGRETAESTRHSRRASPQNPVGASGSVDTAISPAAPDVEPEEEAPTGGGSKTK
jgi:hypothetical protein